MYQSIKLTLLSASSKANTTLDGISNEIINSAGTAMKLGNSTVKGIFDKVVVPFSLLVILITIFFLIFSIGYAKKKRDGEGVEEKVTGLIICFVIFAILAGYGIIFGGLFDMVLGGAA